MAKSKGIWVIELRCVTLKDKGWSKFCLVEDGLYFLTKKDATVTLRSYEPKSSCCQYRVVKYVTEKK